MLPLELVVEPVTVSTAVVHVAGELDCATVGQLTRCIRAIEPGFLTVILDLRDLTFLDSMGIGALVGLHRELDGGARLLQLRNVHGNPRRVLEMTEVHRLLQVL